MVSKKVKIRYSASVRMRFSGEVTLSKDEWERLKNMDGWELSRPLTSPLAGIINWSAPDKRGYINVDELEEIGDVKPPPEQAEDR